jgi:hypothetical protein
MVGRYPELSDRARGWLRFLHRKAAVPAPQGDHAGRLRDAPAELRERKAAVRLQLTEDFADWRQGGTVETKVSAPIV